MGKSDIQITRRNRWIIFALLWAGAGNCDPAAVDGAYVIYVDESSDQYADGSLTAPYPTINQAVGAARDARRANTLVIVAKGVYSESLDLARYPNRLKIFGSGAESIIEAELTALNVSDTEKLSVEAFTIRAADGQTAVRADRSADLRLTDLNIECNAECLVASDASGLRLSGVAISGSAQKGAYISGSQKLKLTGLSIAGPAAGLTIENSAGIELVRPSIAAEGSGSTGAALNNCADVEIYGGEISADNGASAVTLNDVQGIEYYESRVVSNSNAGFGISALSVSLLRIFEVEIEGNFSTALEISQGEDLEANSLAIDGAQVGVRADGQSIFTIYQSSIKNIGANGVVFADSQTRILFTEFGPGPSAAGIAVEAGDWEERSLEVLSASSFDGLQTGVYFGAVDFEFRISRADFTNLTGYAIDSPAWSDSDLFECRSVLAAGGLGLDPDISALCEE